MKVSAPLASLLDCHNLFYTSDKGKADDYLGETCFELSMHLKPGETVTLNQYLAPGSHSHKPDADDAKISGSVIVTVLIE
jgi:hypothetical protein